MIRLISHTERFARRLRPLALAMAVILGACQSHKNSVSYVVDPQVDGLPNVQLVDQNGKNVSLASLRGKPVFIDFIYTSCKTPCPEVTGKMTMVANLLRYEVGKQVTLVSVTIDPEHDLPAQLLAYARAHRAERDGWLFLTGSPADIDQVLAAYKLTRSRESDGSVTPITAMYLLSPDGHERRIYNGLEAKPTVMTADILRTLG
ncbi:MAG TPA: SCO family protein [Candidatus Binataceae bacterium]|nr:SCO family protein [Candidatus Binataceae bacterium]